MAQDDAKNVLSAPWASPHRPTPRQAVQDDGCPLVDAAPKHLPVQCPHVGETQLFSYQPAKALATFGLSHTSSLYITSEFFESNYDGMRSSERAFWKCDRRAGESWHGKSWFIDFLTGTLLSYATLCSVLYWLSPCQQ